MTVYAVVEDFDNGASLFGNEHYENQLIAIFCNKNSAMLHINDGVDEDFFTDKSEYKNMVIYHVNEECSTAGGATLVRRLCKITTSDFCENLSGDFILSQNVSNFKDYIS